LQQAKDESHIRYPSALKLHDRSLSRIRSQYA